MSSIAYTIVRTAMGLNIFMHGFVRIKTGVSLFKNALVKEYEDSMIPPVLVKGFAVTLPAAEAIVGALLFIGLFTETAIIAGSLLMLLLLVGKSVKNDWMVVSLQMIYVALYSVLEMYLNFNQLSMDYFFSQ